MHKAALRLPPLLMTAGALLGGVFVVWLLRREEPEDAAQPRTTIPPLEVQGLRSLVVRSGGKPLWKLSADRIEVVPGGTKTKITGVRQATWYRDGKPAIFLRTKTLNLDSGSNDVHAPGAVQVEGPEELKVATTGAVWRSAAQRLECPQPVTVRSGGWVITAPAAHYDLRTGQISCSGGAKFEAASSRIEAPWLSANIKTRKLEMKGAVQVDFRPENGLLGGTAGGEAGSALSALAAAGAAMPAGQPATDRPGP